MFYNKENKGGVVENKYSYSPSMNTDSSDALIDEYLSDRLAGNTIVGMIYSDNSKKKFTRWGETLLSNLNVRLFKELGLSNYKNADKIAKLNLNFWFGKPNTHIKVIDFETALLDNNFKDAFSWLASRDKQNDYLFLKTGTAFKFLIYLISLLTKKERYSDIAFVYNTYLSKSCTTFDYSLHIFNKTIFAKSFTASELQFLFSLILPQLKEPRDFSISFTQGKEWCIQEMIRAIISEASIETYLIWRELLLDEINIHQGDVLNITEHKNVIESIKNLDIINYLFKDNILSSQNCNPSDILIYMNSLSNNHKSHIWTRIYSLLERDSISSTIPTSKKGGGRKKI